MLDDFAKRFGKSAPPRPEGRGLRRLRILMITSSEPIVCANCGALLEEFGEMVPGATPVEDKWYCGGACDI